MFGYITINKEELKIKDFKKYQSYYCGVCHSLKDRYGFAGQVTLTYDMTFLAILLTSLYEDKTEPVRYHCVPHPFSKHYATYNQYTDYAAAMNIMLTYYKLKDDWEDEKSVKSNAMAGVLKKAYTKAALDFPRQAKAIEKYIASQHQAELNNETNLDKVSAYTGDMLAELFDMNQDEWSEELKRIGFFLGKYIYILDAYDDIDRDIKKDNYNPLKAHKEEPNFKEKCQQVLIMMAAESSKGFEALPILDNADILRNILYSGIWSRFDTINNRKNIDNKR